MSEILQAARAYIAARDSDVASAHLDTLSQAAGRELGFGDGVMALRVALMVVRMVEEADETQPIGPLGADAVGRVVVATVIGGEDGKARVTGIAESYAPAPTFEIDTASGHRVSWRADLCRLATEGEAVAYWRDRAEIAESRAQRRASMAAQRKGYGSSGGNVGGAS